jgi:hypothetical protein
MESIDTFENPFLGMLGNIKKNLGEQDSALIVATEKPKMDGEQFMFETFVKEKTIIIGYVHDMIKFAAKLQEIDLTENKIFGDSPPEETKEQETLRIKSDKECCIIAARINGLVSILNSSAIFSTLKFQSNKSYCFQNICSLSNTKSNRLY